MVNCKQFRNLAGEVLDGTHLPEASAHLAGCAPCRALLEDLRAIRQAASELPDLEPRAELWQRLSARARAEGLFAAPNQALSCAELRRMAGEVLEGVEHPGAFEHIHGCVACRTFLHDLEAIAHAARELPVYQPRPLLWQRLRAQARKEALWREESWWERWPMLPQPVFASAFALLLLLLGFGLTYSPLRTPLPEYGRLDLTGVARGEMINESNYADRYQVHLLQVERNIMDESAPVSDGLIDLIEKPLNTVDRAIEQAQVALSEDPGNPLVRDELNRLYQQKASVLQTMTSLSWQEIGE